MLPLAGFEGRLRRLNGAGGIPGIEATLLEGTLRAATFSRRVCRLALAGPADATAALALELTATVPLSVPCASLAAEAYATARHTLPPRRLGAPQIPPELSVGDAFAFACGHLADVIQHYAPLAATGPGPAPEGIEPVHQMRVAVRRLRSAMTVFRRAVACPELEAARAGLKALGGALGPARDWDVFVTGTGAEVAAAFPEDAGVARLLAAAARRRSASYDALRAHLGSAPFRALGIALAATAASRPWQRLAPADVAADADGAADTRMAVLATDLQDYAAHALSRRFRRLLEPGEDISTLPEASLHAIRLHAKRMRYAAELFAPLYQKREVVRFIGRLTTLQDQLGHLNDGAVAAGLMAELGGSGGRNFAAGIVCGFVAARSHVARRKVDRVWRKLCRTGPFWK
nr:CHAD domain-containing protein [Limobrevibacterium gyesilva]